MVRARDDLCINVPTFFTCPISLDLMKSPVSLCTGITYDRSSIQRWLDAGNNTCPATMQLLKTKDFVPNRTLQSLIQIWSDSLRHSTILSPDQVLLTVSQLETHSLRSASLTKLLLFATDSHHNKLFLSKLEPLLNQLIRFLHNVDGGLIARANIQFLEQVVLLLALILDGVEDRDGLRNSLLKGNKQSLDSLLLVLQRGGCDSRFASSRVLQFIAADAESKILVAEKEGVVEELLKSAAPENDPALVEAALASLIAISAPKRNKLKLVSLGAVRALSRLLAEVELGAAAVEKVLKLVEAASSTREGRKEICEDAACVAAVLSKVLKVSSVATEHAVTTLWSLCYLFRDRKALEAVTQANGLTKILLLMQSNCTPQVRQMCTDLLKIFRVNSKSCLTCYDTKTTHIMPF
ncbi:U-box domain-containing protein 27 [Vigna radiata var. radiata]|uniref:U-box domain-containing protein n=1 Tax=Vigna radiata var. radiata TaxID=3916 RepID=A0A1S3VYI5_VIGRR|nr:U-box domain-containing protein 27 [Vigna radiata var. radiata]